MDIIRDEIEKLKYHVGIIGETIDCERHPVEALILSMGWSEGQVKRAHDIFEEYDNKIRNEENVNWREFENKLKEEFDINYQGVKPIILAFFRNHQWEEVCRGYAMNLEPTTPVEFHCITRR